MISSILDRRGALPALVTALLIVFAAATLSDVGVKLDFANYYDAGAKMLYGESANLFDQFALVNGHPPQGNMEFLAIPISAYLYTPLAMLSPRDAMLAFKIQNTLAFLAGLWLLFVHCRRFAGDTAEDHRRFASLFALQALIYQPFWFTYRVGGQAIPTSFLLFVVALLCHYREKYFLSALSLTAIVIMKPGFATVAALLALLSGIRFLVYLASLGLAAAGISIAALGWPIHAIFLAHSRNHISAPDLWWGNSSLTLTLENLRHWALRNHQPELVLTLDFLRLATSLALAAFFLWLVLKSRSLIPSKQARLHFLYLAALCFGLMLLPVVWEHYLALLFIPLAAVVARRREFPSSAMILIAIIFAFPVLRNIAFALWMPSPPGQDSWPMLVLLGLSKSAPLLLLAVFLQRHYRSWLRTYASPDWIN